MHLVQVAKKPTEKGKVRQLEQQLLRSSPEPLMLTREPSRCSRGHRGSSRGPSFGPIHPPSCSLLRDTSLTSQPQPAPWWAVGPSSVQYFCVKLKQNKKLVTVICAVGIKKKKRK